MFFGCCLAGIVALAVPQFEDVTASSGVDFRFHAGSRGKHDLPEIMGGGVALIDADGDGRLDVFFCDGGPIVSADGLNDPPCRLYRNEGNWRFRDVTATADVPGPGYAMGAAVGDYDGDGRDDLLVTGWRDQRLYHNLGGGRFADATRAAGLVSNLWSTSAAFADLDGDGDLDLYVCNYLDYDPAKAPYCAAPDGKRDYCGPEEFDAQTDRLYRNNGDGTFSDVSKAAGIDDPAGRGLGVLIADLVGDPRPDLYVANDGTPCRLYENRGDLRFEEVGERSGVALDGDGRALAGMGVAFGDLDGDGLPDLIASNFLGRTTVGFQNRGEGRFVDASKTLGLAQATSSVLGFGLGLADFDGDGDLDLIQANGHVVDRARLGEPFAMKPLFLRNDRGRFADASARGGPYFSRPVLGRGVAVGDLDGDGRPDAVVAALDAPPALLKNMSDQGSFLTLDVRSGRLPAVGATVRATIGGKTVVRPLVGGESYLSASGRDVAIGLGEAGGVDRLEVRWPSGRVETFPPPKAGGVTPIVEGRGMRP
jgi:hypothetical protein